jgi:hypothetical protein
MMSELDLDPWDDRWYEVTLHCGSSNGSCLEKMVSGTIKELQRHQY